MLDVLIAFTAIGLDAELCKFNVKHFRAVKELRTVQPY
ncbi:PilT domain-containing protein [Fimbriimonas ginsengisoli Gsoil 348]|uniref:PilT domain-containing protein n=1 Tax=Fimbriimonas ginsengisoli Gsoil 348 TaxID=661478 RepID=A0A068NM72_FIMGI|nr:PilT domain-containing protein [Fimbriimonas ginsengisoli Gsoil 348]